MESCGIIMVAPRGRGALHPLLIGMCVGTVPPPPRRWPVGQGPGAGGRWNVKSKMQIHADKRCRKHVLCDSGNLDISQSQMNMSANTAGQLLGYLKRRFRKPAGVTSQAAGTVCVQLTVIPSCRYRTVRCWAWRRRGRGLFGPWGSGSRRWGRGPGGRTGWSWTSLSLGTGCRNWAGGPACSLWTEPEKTHKWKNTFTQFASAHPGQFYNERK